MVVLQEGYARSLREAEIVVMFTIGQFGGHHEVYRGLTEVVVDVHAAKIRRLFPPISTGEKLTREEMISLMRNGGLRVTAAPRDPVPRDPVAEAKAATKERAVHAFLPRARLIGLPETELGHIAESSWSESWVKSVEYGRTQEVAIWFARRAVLDRIESAFVMAGSMVPPTTAVEHEARTPLPSDRLTTEHAGLAVSRAKRYLTRAKEIGLSRDDLLQEAMAGLAEAAERYDPTRGPFPPFAVKHIDGRLKAALREAAGAPLPVCETDPEEAVYKIDVAKVADRGISPAFFGPDDDHNIRDRLDELWAVMGETRAFPPTRLAFRRNPSLSPSLTTLLTQGNR
jgi:DNA-directed RNA polymerase specialized sigma24 family protein